MTRIVRAPVLNLTPGERTLVTEVSHYLVRVLRLQAGDGFIAFDPLECMEAQGTIVEANEVAARVLIDEPYSATVVASTPLVLVYALAKGDKVDAVVRDATELGATSIVIARTERAVVKTDEARADAKLERWKRIAEQAARQCGRGDGPSIQGVHEWTDALDLAKSDASFCLDPKAKTKLGSALVAAVARGASITFAIGPEGGLTEREIEDACARGYAPVSLGRFVLRTETVGAAILGAVRVLTES